MFVMNMARYHDVKKYLKLIVQMFVMNMLRNFIHIKNIKACLGSDKHVLCHHTVNMFHIICTVNMFHIICTVNMFHIMLCIVNMFHIVYGEHVYIIL